MNPQESAPLASAPEPVNTPQGIEKSGRLFEFGKDILFKHWKQLAPIILLPSIIHGIASIIMPLESLTARILGIVLVVLGVILYVASVPALIDAINRVALNPSAEIRLKDQYAFGFSNFWSYILAALISMLAVLGSAIFFIVPGIIIAIFTAFYAYALILDQKKGFSSLIESCSLVKGRAGKVFGRLIVLGLIALLVSALFALLQSLIGLSFGISFTDNFHSAFTQTANGSASLGMTIVALCISLISQTVVTLISGGYMYKLYMSLKPTREMNADVSKFRTWLKFFIVIGSLAAVALLVALFIVGMIGLGSSSQLEMQTLMNGSNLVNSSSSLPIQQ